MGLGPRGWGDGVAVRGGRPLWPARHDQPVPAGYVSAAAGGQGLLEVVRTWVWRGARAEPAVACVRSVRRLAWWGAGECRLRWWACGRCGGWCGGVRATGGCSGGRAVGSSAGVAWGVRVLRVRRGEQADATARQPLLGHCRPAPLWRRRAMCCGSRRRVPAGAVHGVMGAVGRLSGGGGQCGPRCAAATARPSCAASCGPPPGRVGGGGRSVVAAAVDGGGGGPERSLRGGGGGPLGRQPWPL